ncbi:hypothetical protein ACOMHN_026701 [Nucella lapillus]
MSGQFLTSAYRDVRGSGHVIVIVLFLVTVSITTTTITMLQIISGQFLSDKRLGTYVELDMYGLPTDTIRRKFRTKTIPNNGLNPVYDEEPFVFKKVVLPNLALLRLGVFEETGKLIGHRIVPVEGIKPGYRHIPLRNECNQTLPLQTIFVHIHISDYIPDGLAAYADALFNPIDYISQLDKHAQQLEVLEEEFDEAELDSEGEEGEEGHEEKKDEADSLPKTAIKDMGDKMQKRQTSIKVQPQKRQTSIKVQPQKRQNSIMSRGSNSELSPTSESKGLPAVARPSIKRTGSGQHIVGLTKQESMQSINSQGSGGSGGGLNRMSSAYLGETGAGTFEQNSKLNEPGVLDPTPLDELRTCKPYQKAVGKRDKELDSVKRKYERTRDNTSDQHQSQVDKLIVSQTKARMSLEKSHTKTLKKLTKCGDNTEEKKQAFKGEMETLLKTQGQELEEMRYKQGDTLKTMDCEHYQAEAHVWKRHHTAVYEALMQVLASNHNCHHKGLQDIHDRDVANLKKVMDVQIRDHVKQLAKKHKDKQELARIKREAQQKHIQAVVSEIQRVDDLLAKRDEELKGRLEEIRKQAEKERDEALQNYQEECDQKCQKAQDDFDNLAKELKEEEEAEEGNNNPENTVIPTIPTITTNGPVTETITNGPIENGPVENGPVENGPVENGPVENGQVENGPVENGPVENGPVVGNGPVENEPVANASPTRGPYVSTIYVKGPSGSPVKDSGAQKENGDDEKKDDDEKTSSSSSPEETAADH